MTADINIMRSNRRRKNLCFWGVFFRQNYYASLENNFDVLTLFNVKITVKTKYQMSIDYSTSFWVNYSEHTFLKHDK